MPTTLQNTHPLIFRPSDIPVGSLSDMEFVTNDAPRKPLSRQMRSGEINLDCSKQSMVGIVSVTALKVRILPPLWIKQFS